MSRTGRALTALGAATMLASATFSFGPQVSSATADTGPGSGLGFFSISARGIGAQVRIHEPNFCFASDAAQNGCELIQPEATSHLQNGPLGKGVAAIVWPGALAADIGSLLVTASDGKIPAEARMLNDPVRATAETHTSHETATYDSVPGSSMHATAHDDKVTADGSVESSQVTPVGTFGKTTGSSVVQLSGPATASATGHSSASGVSLAAGVVKIDSVISDAQASTDGVKAKASGKTVVSGMRVADMPVTVDGDGVHVMSTSPLPVQTAQAAVNAALSNAGMTILLGPPSSHVKGSSVDYSAGNLIIFWAPPGGNDFTVTLGGAAVSVNAAPGLADYVPPGTTVQNPPSFVAPPVSGPAPVSSITGVVGAPPPVVDGVAPPATATTVTPEPKLAARHFPLSGGLSPFFAGLGVLGSGLFMLGLKRLPDRVLAVTPPLCPLEATR